MKQIMLSLPYNSLTWILLVVTIIIGIFWKQMDEIIIKSSLKTNESAQQNLLVIGILSARDHFKQRAVIRETWLSNTELNDAVSYKFVVGSSDCNIHANNRKSIYSCEQNNVRMPHGGILPVILFKNMEDSPPRSDSDSSIQWNITITIHQPVIMKRLGLHKAVQLTDAPIKVALYDESREVDIVSVRFSLSDQGTLQHSYRFQAVESVILPKDFIGSVRIYSNVEIVEINHAVLTFDTKDFHGLLSLDYLDQLEIPKSPRNLCFEMLTFQATVFDSESLNSVIALQHSLNEDHQRRNSLIDLKLRVENEKYNDILLVNVTDCYRNLPKKILEFHRWVSSSMQSDFILKTDDDCFMDLENTMADLKKVQGFNKFWWSSFRENWVVERFGKWEERTFRSAVYPTFACGSGNIVSKDISDWVARNADDLNPYQGEDVSMGIWLSAISVNYLHDDRWKCDKTCDKDGYVVPELNIDEMKWFWKNKQTCGNPCSCS